MVTLLVLLNLKESDIGVVPDGRITVAQVDDAPHVRAEPDGRAHIGLVLANQNRVRHGQQADQGAVLQEPQDLILVSDALLDAHFLHLRHQHLKVGEFSECPQLELVLLPEAFA